jgi:hypothetical protein
MTTLFRTLLAGASVLCTSLAHADVVADWNAIALNAVESSGAAPTTALRALAGVHVAMFEAVNFIERRYVPRLVVRPLTAIEASSEAAAAAAAHVVLARLYPAQAEVLDAALERSLAEIPDGEKKASGTTTGRAIGGNVYAVWAWERAGWPGGLLAETVSETLLWSATAGKLIEGRSLATIEAARGHALVSMAVSEVYSAAERGHRALHAGRSCVSCAAGVASLRVLESILASARRPSAAAAESGTPEGSAWVRVTERTDREGSARLRERRVGESFGAQALAHYRPAR